MLYSISKKQHLILDFDSTIADSVKAFCDIYNSIYFKHPDFKEANHLNVNKWNLTDECPLLNGDVLPIFELDSFFSALELFPDAKEVIEELSEDYNLSICTIGTPLNLAKKTIYIANNLPIVKNQILVSKDNSFVGKSMVNMYGAIFMDDVSENLFSSNASTKIAYGVKKPWNEDWKGFWVNNWAEARTIL